MMTRNLSLERRVEMMTGKRAIGIGIETGRGILGSRGREIRGTESREKKVRAEIETETGGNREKGVKDEREKVESEGKEGKRGLEGLEKGQRYPQNPSPSRTSTWTQTSLIW